VDAVEPRVRALLAEFPRMPATVIAERIGWYAPGELAQCDLWFPPVPIQHHMILAGRGGAGDFVLAERRAHERIRTSLGGPRPWGP
jgi:hypothetical protein